MILRLLALIALAAISPLSVSAAVTPKAAGGANQRTSVEGCMNTFLFNGVWRVKVLGVDPAAAYNDGTAETGVGVRVQVRNGTGKMLSPDQTGFSDINGRGISLQYDDDNSVTVVGSGTSLTTALLDKELPPGGASTVVMYFPYGAEKTAKPLKLLIAVDPHATTNYKHVKYSVPNPSFRIKLNCGS